MTLELAVLLVASVLLVSLGAARIGSRLGLPVLLLFLAMGLGLGAIYPFNDAALAHDLGFAALVLILGEGGYTTRWRELRPVLGGAGLLATLGVLVSIAAMAAFGHYVLGLDLATATILGAVTAPTDSAAIFAVLRKVPIPTRVRALLEAESGLNDAPVVLLVAAATAWALGQAPEGGPVVIGLIIVAELAGGTLVGGAIGWLGAWMLRRIALADSGLYPLGALGWALFAYGVGSQLHVSGFAAVYVAGIVMGNSSLPRRNATRSFAEGVSWLAQITLFVMLGMLAWPLRLTWGVVVAALLAGAFLTLLARPLAVLLSLSWFRVPLREQALVSWAGLRGAVPIIMATVPLASGLPQGHRLFDMVFVLVVGFTLLQAPTLPTVARLLGLARPPDPAEIEVEVAPLDRIQADFMQISIPAGSRLHGVELWELRLPPDTVVSLVIREGHSFAANSRTMLRAGDELLVVVPARLRELVERRFVRVGRLGRLAGPPERPTPPRRPLS